MTSGIAAGALALATLPVLGAAVDGRWDAPPRGMTDVLAFLDTEQEAGAFRTLWLGDPSVLPLGGWELDGGLAWGLTDDGLPTVLDRWVGSPDGPTSLVPEAVELAAAGETSRLGRLLSPMGVRYVVVVLTDRPVGGRQVPLHAGLTGSLSEQLDLAEIEVDGGARVFRNAAWFPSRSVVPSPEQLVSASDVRDAEPVLGRRDGANRFEGDVPAGAVWSSMTASGRWRLRVDGDAATPFAGFGWGSAYSVDAGGAATLEYTTPLSRLALSGVQAAAWAAAVYALLRGRRREAAAA